MEQRIGQITPSVPAAGMDPAYIPGITSPDPDAAEDSVEEAEGPGGSAEQSSRDPDEAADAEPAAGGSGDPEASEEVEEEEEEDDAGPAFEVHDHRASILAGRFGITLRLDGEEARFDWDEVGAVQIDLPRIGRRFSVTVHTVARRWYDADVLAPSRSVLKEWEERLDAVLDAHFEDSASEDEPDGETDGETRNGADEDSGART